ncbi:N-6 DNA methylase [Aquipuribacter hungaricus]|uniref:N-6 DNA methylase n=1 Tax=Aquipuribacter hungaricus TaxID=545624 RepID=UPI0030EB2786
MDAALDLDTAGLRKARGAFFTPQPVAEYVTRWAVRQASDRVLEPSCGEAAFLLAALERQTALAADGDSSQRGDLAGVELHAASAKSARQYLRAAGAGEVDVCGGDFFAVEPSATFDAVIGNPPYIRYQDFSGLSRTASRAAALRAGVSLTGLASSWAAFTVHSALFLKDGGRLGLVLPAELLSVNYAAQVREFLMRRFGRVRLVLFTERVFPGVLEEVVLLLAEGTGGTDHCELLQVHGADDLSDLDAGHESTWTPATTSGKWTSALLPAAAAAPYAHVVTGAGFTTLDAWGDTTLGMVTGANSFFALSPARARSLGLTKEELLPLSPPGSRHLRGLSFTSTMRTALGEADARTLLFRPSGRPSAAGAAYIAQGEAQEVHLAYKCQVRTPWWRVPLLAPADLLLTYMNSDTARLTTNTAGARHLNSVHGVYLHPDARDVGRRLLPLASLNSATLLGAEVVGRAYGGGMLKLEPREADHLPVPSPAQVEAVGPQLTAVRDKVTARLRAGRLLDAVRLVDQVLLADGLGVDRAQLAALQEAYVVLAQRRRARGAGPKDRAALNDRTPGVGGGRRA